jgi:hypothetical protein
MRVFVVDEQNLNMIEIIKLHSGLTHGVRVWVCRANYDAFRPCLNEIKKAIEKCHVAAIELMSVTPIKVFFEKPESECMDALRTCTDNELATFHQIFSTHD